MAVPVSHHPLSFVRATLLGALFAACSGGGSDAAPELAAGVDLSGTWSLTWTIAELVGSGCSTTLGTARTDPTIVGFDRATGTVTLGAIDGSTLRGPLAGLRTRLLPALSTDDDLTITDLDLQFTPDGEQVTGTANGSSGSGTCSRRYAVRGQRVRTGSIEVVLATTGTAPLVTELQVRLDGSASPVPANGTARFDDLAPGPHALRLELPTGLGYTVVQDPFVTFDVQAGQTAIANFLVRRETSAVVWLDCQGDLLDRTGNGHDGTIVDTVTPLADRVNFGGGRVELAGSVDLPMDHTQPYTYSLVVMPSSYYGNCAVFGKAPRSGVSPSVHTPAFYVTSSRAVHDYFYSGEVAAGPAAASVPTRYTVTYDGNGHHTIQRDGDAPTTATFAGGNEQGAGWVATLGQSLNTTFPNQPFLGDLFEFTFFDRELTPAEVAQLHAQGPAGL